MLKLSVRRVEFFSLPKLEKWQAGFVTGNVTIKFCPEMANVCPNFLGTGFMERAEGLLAKPTAAQVFCSNSRGCARASHSAAHKCHCSQRLIGVAAVQPVLQHTRMNPLGRWAHCRRQLPSLRGSYRQDWQLRYATLLIYIFCGTVWQQISPSDPAKHHATPMCTSDSETSVWQLKCQVNNGMGPFTNPSNCRRTT